MKTLIAVISAAFITSLTLAAENNEEWLNKHAAVKTTETIEKDGNGNIKSIRVVKDTTIYIRQTATEIHKADKNGDIKPISRTTVSTDTFGGSSVIVEAISPDGTYTTTSMTTTERTDDGMITTVYNRNKVGEMVVISRTASKIQNNSALTITAQ